MAKTDHKETPTTESKPAEKPVSLHPLKFEEALKGLLKSEGSKGGGRKKG